MNRLRFILIWWVIVPHLCVAQYFQQEVNYRMNVEVASGLKEMTVNGTMEYHNNAPRPIDTIYFHLWADAFSDENSAFSEQLLKIQNTKFYFSSDSLKGGYKGLTLGINSGILKRHEEHVDMAYLILKEPLQANSSIDISFSYQLKLPYRWSRTGYKNDYIQLSYWYPKPAVLDASGWNWFPYLSLGEFYSDYGNYDIDLTVPEGTEIVGSGTSDVDRTSTGVWKYKFIAEDVIDMAFVLHKDYQLLKEVYDGKNGKVDLKLFCDSNNKLWMDSAMVFLKTSMKYYEEHIGPYPYSVLTCVQDPGGMGGGMEYPMLITVAGNDLNTLRYYINHEVGHQWFYGILGFNERKFPFLDEGLTTYYEHRYTKPILGIDYHTSNLSEAGNITEDLETPILQQIYLWQKRRGFSESPSSPAQEVSFINYGVNSYEKSAYVFSYIAEYLGEETFDRGIRHLYNSWKFKHPDVHSLIESLEYESGKNLEWIKELLSDDATIDFQIKKEGGQLQIVNNGNLALPFKIYDDNGGLEWHEPLQSGNASIVDAQVTSVNKDFIGLELNGEDNHLNHSFSFLPFLSVDHSRKKELYFSILTTWNRGDGWSLGSAFYNSAFPSKKFQFLLAPQYGFSSKELIGNGWMAYNAYKTSGPLRKIQYKLSAKRYTDRYNENLDYRTQYFRITPQVSFHFKVAPSSQVYKKLTLRSIWLNQESPDFNDDGSFDIVNDGSFIHQLRYDYFNFNVLNRKEYYIQLEQQSYDNPFGDGENYLKLSGALTYDIKYKPSHTIKFRAYAGGFLMNSQRNSSSFNSPLSRGTIALLHQGSNDYSYEGYYLNRQQSNGPFTNQVNRLEGGFKDALGPSYGVGLSNDFAASIGLSFDLPMNLPTLLKFKPYFDVGYYRTKSTLNDPLVGKTIYSGGLMLSYLDGSLEIYLPLFSSSSISNIYDELGENLFQRISFSIDLHRINPWDLIDDLNF